MKIKIYYEDTDAGGVVYHTNYLKYCERARSELFFSRGLMPLGEDGSGFVVRSLKCDFLTPARLGDVLEVTTEISDTKRVSIRLKQSIYRCDIKIFEMDITLVFVKNSKPSKIPQKFLKIFDTL
ncbi:MAG: YbgC/FadM family acyl-CoA thioesterase [Epsilonproteobacteria bacterium]|nr:YbgC/FadM family acyl-CoA thioesterase [Campylobacterota bacterium]